MAEPLVNIDKNVEKMVREYLKTVKDVMPEIADTLDELDDDIKKVVQTGVDGQKKDEESNKGFMSTFTGIKSIFGGVRETMVDVRTYFSKIMTNITGHLREILGPVADAYDFMKDALTSVFDSFKSVWTKLFVSTGIQQKFMAGLFNIFRRQEKSDARKEGKIKKGVLGFFTLLGGIIGLLLGAIFGKIGKPMQLLLKPIKWIYLSFMWMWKQIKAIGTILGKTKTAIKTGTGFFGKIGKLFKWLGRGATRVKKILSFIPGFSALLKGLKFGFKWLGWPLSILLGIIDGVKAFFGTDGSFTEKLIAGFTAFFDSIFELPIKLLAWLPNKILEMFGIDIDVGDKVINFFHSLIEKVVTIFDNFFTMDNLSSLKDKAIDMIMSAGEIFMKVGRLIKTIFTMDFLKDLAKSMVWGGRTPGDVISDAFNSQQNGSDVGDVVQNNKKMKNKKEDERVNKYIASQEENGEKMLKAYNETMKKEKSGDTTIIGNKSGGSDSGRKNIVRENENLYFGVFNDNSGP